MRKVVIHSPGSYDRLQIEEFPDPVPGPGEVVVRSKGIGVNYADVCVRWGVYESAKRFVGWPITPGFEFAGEVVAVGPDVEKTKVGDRVLGLTLFNAYATHVKVPETMIWPSPARLSDEEAAGFPAVFLTAYHGLFQIVRTRPGMEVLVHSAAGGVGSALVQLAALAGLRVTAVVGASHKIDYAKEVGAANVIDKSREDLWKRAEELVPQGFDLVFDANGPSTLKESYRHLRPTGKLVVYGFHSMLPRGRGRFDCLKAARGWLSLPRFNPLSMTSENKSLVAFNLSFLFGRQDLLSEGMHDLLAWLEQGKLRPPRVTAFPFAQVGEAHRAIESGMSVGKLVLTQ